MPEKKKTAKSSPSRARSKSATRKSSRSKSASRDTTRSPASKPRSKSRSKTPSRISRAPASDSKIKKRDSSASPDSTRSSLRSRVTNTELTSQTVITTTRNHISAKLQDATKQTETIINETKSEEKFASSTKLIGPIKKVTSSNILSIVGSVLYLLLCMFTHFWANGRVFAPVKETGSSEKKFDTTLWGLSCAFLGVYWPRDWRVYADWPCFLFVFVFVLCQYLFARFIFFGKLIVSNLSTKRADHRTNGPIIFLLTSAIFCAFEFTEYSKVKGFKPSTYLTGHLFGMQIAMHLLALTMSIAAYYLFRASSRQTRQSSHPNNCMVDFIHGRQSRPVLAGVDWKIIINRSMFLGLFMLTTCYAHIHWEQTAGHMNPSLSTLLMMHFIYITTFFFSESSFLSSHNGQTDLFGYSFIQERVCAPFLYSVSVAYFLIHPNANKLPESSCNYCTITSAGLIFMLGMWIFVASNRQKDRFKREANHPSIANLETIGGTGSQRLLAGGWWGFVRHPNYLGDILINLSFGICCGFESPLFWIQPVLVCTTLIYRIFLTETHSAKKYGALWQKYTNIVPNRLVPKVY